MTPARRALDVAISFIIPTAILTIVFWQVSAFYGNRFNLRTNLAYFRLGLPDVFVLMIVGTIPDYVQGMVKLVWVLRGKARPALAALAVIALLTASCATLRSAARGAYPAADSACTTALPTFPNAPVTSMVSVIASLLTLDKYIDQLV